MKKSFVLLLLAAALATTVPCAAATGRVAVTPKASTLGLGADVAIKMAPLINLRLSGQQFDYERSDTISDVPYDVELSLQSIGATVDLHPFNGSFHVSAGLLANGNEVSSVANLDPAQTYQIGGTTFTGAQLGAVSGDVQFDSTAPYVGVGWGNPFARERRLGFTFDLGLIRQGSPDVSLSVENPSAIPGLDAEIAAEAQAQEDDFEDLVYFPVFSLGLSIRF